MTPRLAQAVAFQRQPVASLIAHERIHGSGFWLPTPIGGRMWVVAAPELAHEVLHAPPGEYLAGRANRRILPVLPSDTVLTLDGDPHQTRRHLLAPLFHGDSLAALAPIIRQIAAEEIARWPIGVSFAALPRTRVMTLRIAARLLLGIQRPCLVDDLQRHLSQALRPYAMLSAARWLRRLGPASPQAAARRSRVRFATGVAEVRSARARRSVDGPTDALDLLGPIAGQSDDDTRVADELFALLLAAHETTATALAWSLELLAHDPDTLSLLAGEADSEDRPHLDAVVAEILRVRPPLVDIVRELAAPARLGDHALAAGTLILIPPPLIHRHRHASPDTFVANRFLGQHPDPDAWLPFGGGERRCLGASLALLELREVITLVAQRFELQPADSVRENARLHGTALIPGRGAPVIIRPR